MKPKDFAAAIEKRGVGRPTLYSPEIIERICRIYSAGVSLEDAARAVGIRPSTLFRWRKLSKQDPKGPFGEFWPKLQSAIALAVEVAATKVREDDPKWWLVRMRPKRFGDPARKIEVTGSVQLTAQRLRDEGVTKDEIKAELSRRDQKMIEGHAVELIDEEDAADGDGA